MLSLKPLRRWAIAAFILICPIVYSPNRPDARDFQEEFFRYAAIVLIATFIGDFWIGLFLILNVLLYVYHGAQTGTGQLINIVFGSLIFMVSRAYFSKNKIEDYFKYVKYIAFASIVFMILQLFRLDPMHIGQTPQYTPMLRPFSDPVGLFNIKSINGIFLTVSACLIASTAPIIAGLMIIPVAVSASSGAVLAFLSCALIYIYNLHRKLFIYALGATLVATGIFLFSDNKTDSKTFQSRLPMWHLAIKQTIVNPIGWGPDSFRSYNKHKNFLFFSDADYNTGVEINQGDKKVFQYYSPSNDTARTNYLIEQVKEHGFKNGEYNFWDNPHNEYIKILFEYGFLGLLLVCGFMREFFIRFKLCSKNRINVSLFCALMVYFISGIVQFPFDLARTVSIFPILLGAFYARTDSVSD